MIFNTLPYAQSNRDSDEKENQHYKDPLIIIVPLGAPVTGNGSFPVRTPGSFRSYSLSVRSFRPDFRGFGPILAGRSAHYILYRF